MSTSRFLAAWTGLALGNAFWGIAADLPLERFYDVTFWQGTALACAWIHDRIWPQHSEAGDGK